MHCMTNILRGSFLFNIVGHIHERAKAINRDYNKKLRNTSYVIKISCWVTKLVAPAVGTHFFFKKNSPISSFVIKFIEIKITENFRIIYSGVNGTSKIFRRVIPLMAWITRKPVLVTFEFINEAQENTLMNNTLRNLHTLIEKREANSDLFF